LVCSWAFATIRIFFCSLETFKSPGYVCVLSHESFLWWYFYCDCYKNAFFSHGEKERWKITLFVLFYHVPVVLIHLAPFYFNVLTLMCSSSHSWSIFKLKRYLMPLLGNWERHLDTKKVENNLKFGCLSYFVVGKILLGSSVWPRVVRMVYCRKISRDGHHVKVFN
jgi:hypothetical protein